MLKNNKQFGATFLELLISLTIFSFTILAVMRLQWLSLQEIDFNEQLTVAQIQLDSVSDQLFINSHTILNIIRESKHILKKLLPNSVIEIKETDPMQIIIILKHRNFKDTQLKLNISML